MTTIIENGPQKYPLRGKLSTKRRKRLKKHLDEWRRDSGEWLKDLKMRVERKRGGKCDIIVDEWSRSSSSGSGSGSSSSSSSSVSWELPTTREGWKYLPKK